MVGRFLNPRWSGKAEEIVIVTDKPDGVFDYIVVGAGSSGCVMAEGLSRSGRHSVLLIEAGGENRSPLVTMPKGIGKLALNPRFAWHYPVEQPRLPGEAANEVWVRGRGLGGSSAINGMIWSRGQPSDFDAWGVQGATGWNWSVMRDAYAAVEDHQLGAGGGRGVGGPVTISPGTFRYPVAEAAIAAGQEMGLARRDDLNGEDIEGIGYYAHNIRNGRRVSSAKAFLDSARGRSNLAVMTNARVQRIVFEQGRAIAVDVITERGKRRIGVSGEVIVSGGAIESPALLQRSGVGPGEVLANAGVPVVADRSAVGRNMLEHLGLSLAFRLSVPGNNREFRGARLIGNVLRYALLGKGPLATGPYEVGAFVRSRPHLPYPDLQLYAGAFTFARAGDPKFPVQLNVVEREPGFTAYGQMLQLTSRGSVAISGADLADRLEITPNWLSTAEDQECAVASFRMLRRFSEQPSLQGLLKAEVAPGRHLESDEDILAYVRRNGRCGTHAVGTCAMGGKDAVLDADCRVRGVSGVRVVDCSAMPGLVSGNTNAPAIAFAWEIARRMMT